MKALLSRLNPARPLIYLLTAAAKALLKARGIICTEASAHGASASGTQGAALSASSCAQANGHHHSGKAGGKLATTMNGQSAEKAESSYNSALVGPAPSERTLKTYVDWEKQYAKMRPGWSEAIRDQASGCAGFYTGCCSVSFPLPPAVQAHGSRHDACMITFSSHTGIHLDIQCL